LVCAQGGQSPPFSIFRSLVRRLVLASEAEQEKVDGEISAMVAELARSSGIEVVELRHLGAGDGSVLRIDVDRAGPDGVTLDDCQRFSMALEIAMDDRDLIENSYTLEVSSPGMDRPIVTPDDIRRNTGRKVMADVRTDSGETRKVAGILMGMEGETLILGPVDHETGGRFPWSEVVRLQQFLPF
jgi:ribosome maturation factor RimP